MTLRLRLVLCVLALVLAACTSGDLVSIPDPPDIPATTTTTVVDFSQIDLGGVPGRTTTTLAVGPGPARMEGTVVGPDGPVEGAIVRAERLVGDAVAVVDVPTAVDGVWSIPDILGGRYRLRAWKVPELSLVTPEIFFLDSAEKKSVNLALTRYSGMAASGAIAPDPPVIDTPANLAVQVTERTVDDQGVVRGIPRAGVNVELFGSGDWQLQSANPATSDGTGVARFRVMCRRAGEQPLQVVVADSRAFPLSLPPCAVPPPDPDEEPPPTSTTIRSSTTTRPPGSSTTTTRPTSTTTSTSTTAPPRT